MNKLAFAAAVLGCLAAVHAAADPLAPVSPFDTRADAALLFAAADRHAALAEALGGAVTPRWRVGMTPLPDPLRPAPEPRRQRYLSGAEFEQKMGRGTGIVSVGLLREAGGAPGMQSMSMLLNTRPTTRFTSLSLGYALSPRNALVAMASYGKTEGIGSPDSLLAQVSAVRTLAYSIGYARRLDDRDRLAVTWSMPARVRGGALDYSGAAAGVGSAGGAASMAGAGGTAGMAAGGSAGTYGMALGAPRLNLRPTAVERDLEFSYTRAFGRDGGRGRLTGAVMWRVNPGHDANARPDLLTGVRYSYGF